ncbi:MAG TPA: UvrD-helicase domain-containing protein [Thermoanaerobaculia bacterium]|nr:UvrD-helicase domain-containing protein [Thermoanaerobaculia bacterium]
MIDFSTLNPQQLAAVTHGQGPLLVLAGAGSGKTRVITYRIAHLIGGLNVPPSRILAVTFTNKAAAEMVSRVTQLVPYGQGRPMVGTFHSTSLRLLRRYADRLGYTKSFIVYDTSDQLALIRRILRELGFSEDALPPRTILSRISSAKNELIGPSEFEKRNTDFVGSKVSQIYRLYQIKLKEFDAMDFDDLIGQHVYMLRNHEDIRQESNERFEHLLIDEYQDTNHAQYALVKLLAGPKQNIVAVGDEDQSIYKFRGADINNILNFEKDFPGAKIIKLEQNYRSTGNILDAATGVVSNNVARKGKTLFTDAGKGEPVRIVTCESEREEARFVVNKVSSLRSSVGLREMAILFRTNAQSRPFEEELLRSNLPYVVVGGVKFYERAEIKDLLSYLRLTMRPHDTPSLERVINTPPRGIGDTTIKALDAAAKAENVSLWTVIQGDLPFLAERARKALREFRELVEDLQKAATQPIPELVDFVLLRTGYRKMLLDSNDPQDDARMQNIEELVNSTREFYDNNDGGTLADYLDSVTLISDVDRYDDQKGVTLMTLHSAKGLEYRVVFLAGMEEGILPHSQSVEEDNVEEERRLCYVGMTRAREQLYCLTCAERRIHGQFRTQSPSPFLSEIPDAVRDEIRLGNTAAWSGGGGRAVMPRRESPIGAGFRRPTTYEPRRTPSPSPSQPPPRNDTNSVLSFFQDAPVKFDPSALKPARERAEDTQKPLARGSRVRHEQFGVGVILTMEGSGENAKISVYFDKAGTKKFIAKYAKLTRL